MAVGKERRWEGGRKKKWKKLVEIVNAVQVRVPQFAGISACLPASHLGEVANLLWRPSQEHSPAPQAP